MRWPSPANTSANYFSRTGGLRVAKTLTTSQEEVVGPRVLFVFGATLLESVEKNWQNRFERIMLWIHCPFQIPCLYGLVFSFVCFVFWLCLNFFWKTYWSCPKRINEILFNFPKLPYFIFLSFFFLPSLPFPPLFPSLSSLSFSFNLILEVNI